MNIAIIVGASGGMGSVFAKLVSREENIDELWLISRREEKLNAVAEQCEKSVRIIVSDITESEGIEKIRNELEKEKPCVKWFFNCAGVGYYGDFVNFGEQNVSVVELNCVALTRVTALALDYMNEKSHILNISSASAFLPQEKFAVYSATKAYVLSFSRAISEELRGRKIYVSVACPGPLDTEFLSRAYKGKMPRKKKSFVFDCERVCERIYKSALKGRKVIVPTLDMKIVRALCKIFPHSILLKLVK